MKTQEKKQKQVQPKKIEESLSYTVEVRDKEGRVIQRVSAPSRSYVQAWNQILNVQASGTSKTIKDTEGNNQSEGPSGSTIIALAAATVTLYGIRVGTGNTPVAITDYALESPCGEGTSTDEFNHQAVSVTEPSVIGSTCSFAVTRLMINNSGSTITIREIGCYNRWGSTYFVLGFRDVLGSPVNVPDGGAITVTYTIKVTV